MCSAWDNSTQLDKTLISLPCKTKSCENALILLEVSHPSQIYWLKEASPDTIYQCSDIGEANWNWIKRNKTKNCTWLRTTQDNLTRF